MSTAHLPCPACNEVLRLADSTPADALLLCPKCGERFRRPAAEAGEEGIVVAEAITETQAPPLPAMAAKNVNSAGLRKICRSEPPSQAKFWAIFGTLTTVVLLGFLGGCIALYVWVMRAVSLPPKPPLPPESLTPFAGPEFLETSPVGWFLKGNRLMQKGDNDGAIAAFTRAIELDPQFARAYCNRGLARSDKGDFDGAIADCTKAIELNPNEPFSFINRANARIRKGVDPEASIADATRALELRPDIPAALLNLGMARDLKGDFDGAIAEFDKALVLLPTFDKAYAQRGQAFLRKKQWDKAEADFTSALDLNLVHPSIYHNRACCRMEKGDQRGAIADFTAALELDPKGIDHYYRRSQAALMSGDVKTALADLDKALAIKPALLFLHSLRAKILLREGEADKSLAAAEGAAALQPQSPDALMLRAFIHAWRGEKDKALADYAAALKRNPKYAEVHLMRGWFYLSVGQDDKAAEDADAALKLVGLHQRQSPYLAILANCARRRQHPEQARRDTEAMLKEVKKDWPGPILRYLHEDISAKKLLDIAADNDQRTEARGYSGVVLWLSGDAGKARDHLQWVRDHGTPDFIEFDLALLLLHRLEMEPPKLRR